MKKLIISITLFILIFSAFSYADPIYLYTQSIEGFIRNINGDRYTIEDYDGNYYTYTLDSRATLLIDERSAAPKDLRIGMEVMGKVSGDMIFHIESFSNINLGYIAPGSKVRAGLVVKIDRDQITLKDSIGREETYFISPLTLIFKNGNSTDMSALYVGDRVKLHFDEIHSQTISRMYIQGRSIVMSDILKGELNISDRFTDRITVENVHVLKNGKWEFLNSSMTLPFNGQNDLYIGGMKIDPKNLKYYKGKTIYMVTKDFFGKNHIERMVLKSQYESTYSEKITDINWYADTMELSNTKNLRLNDGTIIIKNGRLVDRYSLNSLSDAYIISDGRGDNAEAALIYIYNEDLNNSNAGQNHLYCSRLDKVIDNNLYLLDFFHLNQNEWESFTGEKELYFDNDTIFFDLEKGKQITLKEFTHGNYAVDEKSREARRDGLRDYYGYIYTEGDRISIIYIQKNMDSLLKQKISTGKINKLVTNPLIGNEDMFNEAVLSDVRDWNIADSQWKARNGDVTIRVDGALIIKAGKMIASDELIIGDRLYLVRDDYHGKVIFVK